MLFFQCCTYLKDKCTISTWVYHVVFKDDILNIILQVLLVIETFNRINIITFVHENVSYNLLQFSYN